MSNLMNNPRVWPGWQKTWVPVRDGTQIGLDSIKQALQGASVSLFDSEDGRGCACGGVTGRSMH